MTNYTLTGNQYEIKYIDNKNRKHILSLASIGASIRQYTIDSLDIVTPYPTNQIPQYFQGQVLFPWANRLEDGLYEFEDQTIQTNINEIDKNNQLHGLSPLYSFELINQGENWITLGLDLPPQKAYPFSINTQIKYKLTDSGLIIESQIHNNGNKNAPFMLGWHPWFSTRGNMDKASLQFVAKKYVCVNSRLLPINESSVPAKFNFSENKKLKNIALDDAFLNVKNNTIKLTGADGHITIIEADRSYKVWQICSANFPNDENYRFGIAIEPMTAYANSFKTKTNLIILKPSITIKNSWSIDFI